jgi:membrane-associated phospholipid phosphatase
VSRPKEIEMRRDRTPLVIHGAISGPLTVFVLAITTLVVTVSSIIAADGDVAGWERDVLFFFNDWPDRIEPLMWLLQQPGVLFSPVIAGAVIVWFTRRWYHLLPFLAVLPLKLGVEKAIVKQLVERERPYVSVGPEVEVRGGAFDGLSFPSGHTTTAFAMFILVSAYLPSRWRAVPVAGAVIVAAARLYYGEHNFLDVLAGAAMGTAFATLLWFLFINRVVEPVEQTAQGPVS